MIGALAVIFAIQMSGFAQQYDEYTLEDSVTVTAEKDGQVATYNTVATKLAIPLKSTPASISVVTNQLVSNQGGVILSDALTNVSGVNVQSNFGVHEYFLVRGFNSLENGLLLTDNTREPEATYYNMYNMERVEVLKGPGAFLYGGNALSGTVNMVRKQPVFDEFVTIGGSYGKFNSYRAYIDAGYGDPESGIALRLNGIAVGSDFYRDDKKNNTLALNPSATWRINDKVVIHADYEYANSEYKPDSGVPLVFDGNTFQLNQAPDVPRTNSYQTPFDFSDQIVHRAKADINIQLSKHVTLRDKLYYTEFDWKSRGTQLLGAFPVSAEQALVSRSLSDLDDRQRLLGNQLELIVNFKTGTANHKLLTGLEVIRLTDDYYLGVLPPLDFQNPQIPGLPPIDLYNPVETADPNTVTFPFQESDARTRNVAPYFIDQIAFSPKFKLFLGGRFDAINYEAARVDAGFPSSPDTSYSNFSPMAGLVVQPSQNTSIYANAGTAFGPPSSQTVGTPKPEKSSQIEVGLKQDLFDGKLSATIALYNLEKENITVAIDQRQTRQVGSQRSNGLEVEFIAEPARKLLAFLTYAYTDAELTEFSEVDLFTGVVHDRTGNKPAFAPEHIVNLWASREFDNGFGLGAGVRYLSSQYIGADNVFQIDGYTTLDALAYYKIGNVRLGLNFKNLTSTEFESRGFNTFTIIPADPFATFGTLEIKL